MPRQMLLLPNTPQATECDDNEVSRTQLAIVAQPAAVQVASLFQARTRRRNGRRYMPRWDEEGVREVTLIIARAIAIRCFCPPLSWMPDWPTCSTGSGGVSA